ncbi:kinesin-like protein KIN-7I [Phoenix dactylifera]|uniref:Kinesin-like protein KIN-7I n=1 Tax=Phoenix dactylifera TaxID=42345 RepID=A0A8B8ZUG2_PHODC|nr:kinesin-like protein KIN-7I [Phoenix dactylifera]
MERIYVTVRARPLSPEDAKNTPWRISSNSIHLANQSTKFEFDRIFGEDCMTLDVYEARTKDIVASVVRGFNGTVFAYGQTNSGKTYTMRGSVTEPGIIPLAVHDLFQSIQEDLGREFLVRMSYMEIYNEEINDLLAPEHRKLQIHESIERGIYVAGLREEIVTCPEQVLDLMEFGESHRHIGETNMNLYSSRSHTIFRMIVESREKVEDSDIVDSCDAVRVSVLNLVDLAGSERAAKTGAEGVRLKEGSHINKSLLTLGTVIKKLSEGAESQGSHVPYRDSKLTRILQPALGGNANTAIICNITLAQVHTDETKNTLQFASRALRVTNCACVNEILTDAALLKRQRKEIEELRAKLLSSHSEHLEEEILNLRNTLLQSELEKERIALELEEEKKAKDDRERRLLEQAKKIANLSSLVLCSERDEKRTYLSKNKRRVTWCPGPSSRKGTNEVHTPDQAASIIESIRHERDMGLPLPFEELMHENEAAMDENNGDACLPDSAENENECKDFLLPDAHALLHVTSRRKMHVKGGSELAVNHAEYEDNILEYDAQRRNKESESESTTSKFVESESTPGKTSFISSVSQISGSASCESKSLTARESEAIFVIKQLQDQIKSLEMEKVAMQRNLENVMKLATEQNASFREKYEELHQEALNAREEARVAHEQEESKVDSSSKISMEIQDIALQVDHSRNMDDNIASIVEELLQNFSILSKFLLELKSFASEDVVRFKSIISGHEKVCRFMRKRIDELELEKNLLHNQSVDQQKQIQELKSDLDNREKAMAEHGLQHDLEKDELLCRVLGLQKEVSCLSSSCLTKEKESLRKELEKTKMKLKDTESKLKNAIKDKIKLESEKAQAEREIKHLQCQRAILDRDIRKRDSLIDRRRESKSTDFTKPKGVNSAVEQALQEDYQKLEVHAFEMEAEIASLKEALISAIGEKEEAFASNDFLNAELESFSDKWNEADSKIKLLNEEVAVVTQRLHESESFSKKLEASLDSLYKEKEEMAMQLTDALLEVEAEKSTWSAKEKAFTEANERLKISNDEIFKLSEKLSKVKHELESCREQCGVLRERLVISEENAEKERECSTVKPPEIAQLRIELKQCVSGSAEDENLKSKFELLSSEYHHAYGEVQRLQEQLIILTRERDKLSLQVEEKDTGSFLLEDYQNLKSQLLMVTSERDDLTSKNEELNTVIVEAEVLRKKYDDMLLKARRDSDEFARRISSTEVKMHTEALNYNKERTKLRMRLRSMQAKLDALRVRYNEVMDEMGLMNKKFEEASTKLKKQLASYGVEILRLKKQLSTDD